MISKIDLMVLAAVAGVLFISKPSPADVEQVIKDELIADINAAKLNKNGDFFSNFLTLTCKFDAESCYPLARATVEVSYKDRILFSAVGISANGKTRNCIGAFKNIFCPKFLN